MHTWVVSNPRYTTANYVTYRYWDFNHSLNIAMGSVNDFACRAIMLLGWSDRISFAFKGNCFFCTLARAFYSQHLGQRRAAKGSEKNLLLIAKIFLIHHRTFEQTVEFRFEKFEIIIKQATQLRRLSSRWKKPIYFFRTFIKLLIFSASFLFRSADDVCMRKMCESDLHTANISGHVALIKWS
jgi:hypothetical protein